MIIDPELLAAALEPMSAVASLPQAASVINDAAQQLGAHGVSIGVVHDVVVECVSVGFDDSITAAYATFPVKLPLPGPHVVRTGDVLLLPDRETVLDRFPAARPILDGTDLGAAACWPLAQQGATVGYLAVHYEGSRTFEDRDIDQLRALADATNAAVERTVKWSRPGHGPSADEVGALREEVMGLREAMTSRAVIERAKGMLMQRFGIDADAAWTLLRRLSSSGNIKVRDLALAITAAGDIPAFLLDDPAAPPTTIGSEN